MSDSLPQLMLGYLLQALEQEETENLVEQLGNDPKLQQQLTELRQCLDTLGGDYDADSPTEQLADRTCSTIWNLVEKLEHSDEHCLDDAIVDDYDGDDSDEGYESSLGHDAELKICELEFDSEDIDSSDFDSADEFASQPAYLYKEFQRRKYKER